MIGRKYGVVEGGHLLVPEQSFCSPCYCSEREIIGGRLKFELVQPLSI